MMVLRKPFLSVLFASLLLALCGACLSAESGPKTLCQRESPYNTVIVTDEEGLRVLRFEPHGARQTVAKPGDPDHLELPYTRAILAALAFVGDHQHEKYLPPERVLLVGVGGGTLPTFLRRHYPKMTIDAVDIDPEVVRAAKEFFAFKEDDAMRAHVADGRKFIEEVRDPYDLVLLDAYGADSIPFHLATREFLEATRRATKPHGAVVSNVWSRESNALYDRMVRTYQEVFAEVYVIDVRGAGNRILVALPQASRLDEATVAGRASRISTQGKYRFDLGEMVKDCFRRTLDKDPKTRVLTDAERTMP